MTAKGGSKSKNSKDLLQIQNLIWGDQNLIQGIFLVSL